MGFSQAVIRKLKRFKCSNVAGTGDMVQISGVLARSGVGHLHIVDFDIVDITNLNEQVYTVRHIGSRKVDTCKLSVEINPYGEANYRLCSSSGG